MCVCACSMYSRTIALFELMFLLTKPTSNKSYFTLLYRYHGGVVVDFCTWVDHSNTKVYVKCKTYKQLNESGVPWIIVFSDRMKIDIAISNHMGLIQIRCHCCMKLVHWNHIKSQFCSVNEYWLADNALKLFYLEGSRYWGGQSQVNFRSVVMPILSQWRC